MDLTYKICNLCLIKCENYKSIEGNMKTILDTLLPTKVFTVIREPVMCKKCAEMLWKCFAFKDKCLNSYDDSVPLVNDKNAVKLDPKDICLRQNATGAVVPEYHEVCGFCMNLVKSCYAIFLKVDKERVILEKMIERCLPELDLSVIKNPIICADCHRSLENCFRFVTNCLATEEKIKKYLESLDIDSKSQIDLNSLLHSIITAEASDIDDDNIVDTIETGKQFCMKIENPEECEIGAIKLEHMSYDDNECVNVIGNKNESMSDCAEDNMLRPVKIEETFCAGNETKPEDGNVGELDDLKCILNEEIEIKTDDHDFNRFEENIVMTQTRVTNSNSRQKCLTSKPKNESEVTMFKCDSCPYVSSRRNLHKNHMLIHMDSSEVTMFKCDSCPFQARRKEYLKKHMLKHMDPSDIAMFKCDSCSFKTKRKDKLKSHALTHMNPSEVTMFECDSCSFETKRKHNLKVHMLKHMDPSELTMFTCDFCPFQARLKFNVKNHMLKHMDPSEVTMFKCDFCSFQSRRKDKVKSHALTHMDPSEVTMFKCDSCPFQARKKYNLKRHNMLKHMDPSEVTVFTCDLCPYQTKYNDRLKRHMKTHK